MSSTSHSTLIYKSTLVASVGGLLFGYEQQFCRGFYENLLSAFGYHDGLGGFMCTARMYWEQCIRANSVILSVGKKY
jgi:SP family arabinose:H+ symporter-like MFS transporter